MKRFLTTIVCAAALLGCYDHSTYGGVEVDFSDEPDGGLEDSGGEQVVDKFDWSNCGQPTTYPDTACQTTTTGDVLEYDVELTAEASVLTFVVNLDPWDGHYREPEHRPSAWLRATDPTSGVETMLGLDQDVTELPNYDKPHALYVVADVSEFVGQMFTVCVVGEHGKYSLNGLKVFRPLLDTQL